MIEVDGSSLTLEQLVAIADRDELVAVAAGALQSVERARAVVDRRAESDEPVYGINTGFGALAETPVSRHVLGQLQINLLRSHAAGVGEPLSDTGSPRDDGPQGQRAGEGFLRDPLADADVSSSRC